ncbi:phosphotransferase family protein [Halorubellus litoreus]|uniref:Phosphotransferase family protein n=1 Tax=Halorubellus litoreus TaxID=755308 RepID=A0ABD5VGK2_9EURY
MTLALADLDVDAAALRAFLDAELPADAGRVIDLDVLADGLNLVVAVSTASERDAFVVRSPRKFRDASYVNDVAAERRVLEHLASTDVPAPSVVASSDDEGLLGAPLLVQAYVDGDVVPLGSDLPERFRRPAARERVAHDLVDVLAAIHDVDVAPLADALDVVSPCEQVERSRARLDAATDATGLDVPALDAVGDWLHRHAPDGPGTASDGALVHGDYRPGNVLLAPGDDPAIAAVLDWETAMLGDPLTELGYLLLRWRDPGDPTPALAPIEARYPDCESEFEHLRRANERGFAPFTSKPGSPTRRELVARYETATGRAFADARFYVALAAFNLATVWTDLHHEAVAADEASDWPPHIAYVARFAELVVDGELPLS